MSGSSVTAKFFVRGANLLVERDRLVDYLSAFAQVGYHLTSYNEKAAGMAWRGVNYGYAHGITPTEEEKTLDWNLLFTPGMSPQAAQEIDTFCAKRGEKLSLMAYSTARSDNFQGQYLQFYTIPEVNSIDIMIKSDFIRTKSEEQRWESLQHMTYSAWHPIYGYPYYSYASVSITRDEALSHPIRYLFPLNFWGPEIVDQFGLQRVVATPGTVVQELDDGGVFIKPRVKHEAATYLGLTSPPHILA